jgi:hypothetical protein
MNRNPIPSKQVSVISLRSGGGLARLALLLCLGTTTLGHARSEAQSSVEGSAIRVTHVLEFEAEKHNETGELAIRGDSVQFQRNEGLAAVMSISSIQDIFIGDEDKQVGGTPMMLAKTAAPFGGGRVVSLFSHKKYDVLTIEYLDNDSGVHFAIFQLKKGQGQSFKKDLVAHGAHIAPPKDQAATQSTPEVKNANK